MLKYLTFLSSFMALTAIAQDRRPTTPTTPTSPASPPPAAAPAPAKPGPKAYKEVITDKSKTTKGLFVVHKIDEKYFFELPDSLLGKEMMAVTRLSQSSTTPGSVGLPAYGGELLNRQVVRFEKGPENKLFMRAVAYINVSEDANSPIYKAVRNSNVDPIAMAFDIKAVRKDTSVVIEVTDFFKGENAVISMSPVVKQAYKLTTIQTDRTYIQSIKSFPLNTEIKVVKTYGAIPAMPTPPSPVPSPIPSVNLPASSIAGAVTMELNTSFIALPAVPMKQRLFDIRVGYFANGYRVYGENSQRTEDKTFVVRWRLEPKNKEDEARQRRGELIEPKKPIIYYIDSATPEKWRKYLKMGVDDWNVAFEKAGWKNAIQGVILNEKDTTISLEDARNSAIRYFASDIENAYGPNVHDPRTGEILESHIGWYHNVMKLLKKWYMTQAAAADPRARKNKFDDELMGQLIRFVSSHEVGHTLGLRHNYGASTATPVEKLRDKEFTSKNGHTSSIMDYARFNYVAQPEDGVTDFFPRIGDYDIWAIEWAYKPIYDTKTPEEDKVVLNKWYKEKAQSNRRLWFLTETNPYDPRAQNEDVGDNAMLSSDYGIKNLKRIVPNLVTWTSEEAEDYEMLEEGYNEVVTQYRRYLGHVTKYVGGVYETPKTMDQEGVIYEVTPKKLQKDAVTFLNQQLFATPTWLLDANIMRRIRPDMGVDFVSKIQEATLTSLFAADRLQRIIEATEKTTGAYTLDELFTDVRSGIWTELKTRKAADTHRRNLQKIFVERMVSTLNLPSVPAFGGTGTAKVFGAVLPPSADPRKGDIQTMVRAHLTLLRSEIQAAIPATTDKMTKYHLQDCLFRITKALDPK
ncbi:zinc-dependent metalloprotease [Runella aurantiaca]|uniref:DUF5117 domain-containing protein n=1 Tax=Runella aurantiaca TaxID=2282308 RepID=A0A369I9S3_9BACT|nr:zinc-dependent metalloprotease [Runella aurantiaca]RDB05812.1 DUF5117 domain-containing protein [Runella aurantiaca]